MNHAEHNARWRLCTPAAGVGAIAIIQIEGEHEHEVDAALARLRIAPVRPGEAAPRDLCGVDRGLVARWTSTCAQLMPHGGIEVVRALIERLLAGGIRRADDQCPRAAYPEARDEVEARALHALARAQSPLALDLLLDQSRRWRGLDPRSARSDADLARDRVLNRLIDPALVVIVGPPNIGKSTLVNALAGRAVSIVADIPGTTRDHVGVRLDLAGVVAHVVDAPGIREAHDPIERAAIEASLRLIAGADLVIAAGDPTTAPLAPGALAGFPAPRAEHWRVCLRADLGVPAWRADHAVSARSGAGIPELVTLLRERLVPSAAINNPAPWKFW